MRLVVSFLLMCCAPFFLFSNEHDGSSRFQQDLNDNDFDAIREFVQTKRVTPLLTKLDQLSISGDVRVDWRYAVEKLRGENLRGGDGVFVFREISLQNDEIYEEGEKLPLSRNIFDVQFNLYVDYVTECSWAVTQVSFDNSMGVDSNGVDCSLDPEGYKGSGSVDNLNLIKAYLGYNLYSCNNANISVELGRLGFLFQVFESQIQFLSRFDGALFTYVDEWEGVASFYTKLGGFVIDERVNHFGWAAEIGLLNICQSGIDLTYSIIDWRQQGPNRCGVENSIGNRFLNSQWQIAYHFFAPYLQVPTELFAGYLINHTPANHTFEMGSQIPVNNQNTGWYVGVTLGEVLKEGDWSFQGLYAYVGAEAMPDNDVRKIGTGNVLLDSFTADAVGNVNFKGFQLAYLYALTDHLLINSLFDYSRSVNKKIGGSHEYAQYKLEAIYAF